MSSGSTRKKSRKKYTRRRWPAVAAASVGGGGEPAEEKIKFLPTHLLFVYCRAEAGNLNGEEGSIKTETTPTRKSAAQHPLRPPRLLVLTSSGGGYTQHDDDSAATAAAAVFHIATPFFFLTLSTQPLYFLKIFQFYRFGGRKCCLFPF